MDSSVFLVRRHIERAVYVLCVMTKTSTATVTMIHIHKQFDTHTYGNSSRSRVVNVKSHPSPVIYIPVDAVMFFLYARDSAVAFETCLDGKTATVKN